MAYFSRLMIIPVLLATTAVQADVRLQLGDGVNLHAINGEAWSGPGVFDARSPITLENGTHQLVVDVTAELGRNRDDSVIESSDSFVLLFRAKDQDIRLTSPDIETRKQLEDFNDQPSWILQDAQGSNVAFKLDVLKKRGFQLIRDYEDEIADFNREGSSGAAMMPRRTMQASLSPSSRPMPSGDTAEDQEVVRQMLRYWYSKADKNTKSEMKRWINSGE